MGIGLGHKRHPGLMLLIVSAVIALDQLTKWLVTSAMRLHESIPVIPGLFSITYIRNSGAAFGILAGSHAGFRLLFFGLTSVLALALLGTIYVRLSPADWAGQVSVSAIFGGAVGNLIDRSEEHTSELQSPCNLVCRLLLEKKKSIPLTRCLQTVLPP